MHPAQHPLRVAFFLAACLTLTAVVIRNSNADRTPLIGSGGAPTGSVRSTATAAIGMILPVDPATVPCTQITTFEDVAGGAAPGTNYDGVLPSGGMLFAERFMGQTLSANGDFDVVSGNPSNPLAVQTGLAGQNLDVFDFSTNVLTGLGNLGYPDIDAIGEGSIAMVFPTPQSRVSFELVGGNGGSATLSFYRTDGTLIDAVVVSGLADLAYGFATADGTTTIAGILIQNTDPSGIGVDNICRDGGITGTRAVSWGGLKLLYR